MWIVTPNVNGIEKFESRSSFFFSNTKTKTELKKENKEDV